MLNYPNVFFLLLLPFLGGYCVMYRHVYTVPRNINELVYLYNEEGVFIRMEND